MDICEISSSHGGEYDVYSCLLGCTAVYNPEDSSEQYGHRLGLVLRHTLSDLHQISDCFIRFKPKLYFVVVHADAV
jgi:hypothetical protein